MTVAGIDHVQVAIPPGREDDARHFYGGLLGLEELPKPAVLAARGGVWFRCGDQQLHVRVEAEFRPARKAHPALVVHGLAALRDRLTAAGCDVQPGEDLPGTVRCFVADPFGNRIELVEHE